MIVNSFPLFFTLALIRPGANSGSTRSPVDCVKLPSSSKMNVREKQKNKNRTRKNKINSRKQGCQLHCRVHKFKDWGTSNIFTHWQSLQLILWKKKHNACTHTWTTHERGRTHWSRHTRTHPHTQHIHSEGNEHSEAVCNILPPFDWSGSMWIRVLGLLRSKVRFVKWLLLERVTCCRHQHKVKPLTRFFFLSFKIFFLFLFSVGNYFLIGSMHLAGFWNWKMRKRFFSVYQEKKETKPK